ncbi:hypothetical protein [Isoptericola sp. BMS4]|uniref:hypothetical protein n=1 Tax=Isoptericola sp. BMS4 TaxID=2527875 RepID=UPI00142265A3|nr:hypothetical protein [Isoptericola sp. BMS4]
MGSNGRLLVGVGVVVALVAGLFLLTPSGITHAWFVLRERLPSCGVVEHGVRGGGIPDDARACLDDAWGSGAELTVTTPTVEGDPTTTYYRVGGGGLEIFRDTTADTYGAGAWRRKTCPGADLEDARAHC